MSSPQRRDTAATAGCGKSGSGGKNSQSRFQILRKRPECAAILPLQRLARYVLQSVDVVITFRNKVSALTVATTLVVTMFGAPIAAEAQQQRCAASHHPCGTTETLRACCCGHVHSRSMPAATETHGPNASVETAPPVALPAFAQISSPFAALVVQPTPRGSPPDLPTLYAALLI
jgi:hypothetical protein